MHLEDIRHEGNHKDARQWPKAPQNESHNQRGLDDRNAQENTKVYLGRQWHRRPHSVFLLITKFGWLKAPSRRAAEVPRAALRAADGHCLNAILPSRAPRLRTMPEIAIR
jgi:hypothetical protein